MLVHMKQKDFQELVSLLTRIDDTKLMREFLLDLLTPKEVKDLSVRFQLVKDLDTGLTQREVQQKYGVGIATVSRGARALQSSSRGFKQVLNWWTQ